MIKDLVVSAPLDTYAELRASLAQPVCFRSGPFLTWVLSFVAVGIIVPLVLLLINQPIPAYVLFAVGGVWLIWALWPILFGETPPAPPPIKPLTKPLRKLQSWVDIDIEKEKEKEKGSNPLLIVIANPFGGGGRAKALLEQTVDPMLRKAGLNVQVIWTKHVRHCYQLLAGALPFKGISAVIIVGGDGTFSEAVNGLQDRVTPPGDHPILDSKRPLGLVPAGSGNSYMHDFGMDSDPVRAVSAIIGGCVGSMDCVRVVFGPGEGEGEGRVGVVGGVGDGDGDVSSRDLVLTSSSSSSSGIHPHVMYSVNVVGYTEDHCLGAVNIDGAFWRTVLGSARYDVCSVWGLLKGAKGLPGAKLHVNGKPMGDDVQCLFANTTQHFGKGMRAAPSARLDDGQMDLGVIGGSRGQMLKAFTMIHTGAAAMMTETAGVFFGTPATTATITTPNTNGLFNLDGEVVVHHHNSIQLDVVSDAFELFVLPEHTSATPPVLFGGAV